MTTGVDFLSVCLTLGMTFRCSILERADRAAVSRALATASRAGMPPRLLTMCHGARCCGGRHLYLRRLLSEGGAALLMRLAACGTSTLFMGFCAKEMRQQSAAALVEEVAPLC
jgi:hypothetical protein